MSKSPPLYPAEFRRRIVELARAGRPTKELSAEFGPCDNTIRNWIKQADLEREILSKAAAWFARETGSISSGSSSS